MNKVNEQGNLSKDSIPISRSKMSKKNIWFVRKRYGWGWMPSPKTWQGWILLIGFALLAGTIAELTIGALETNTNTAETIIRIVAFMILLATEIYALFRISYKYGEEPHWQWGDKRNEPDK